MENSVTKKPWVTVILPAYNEAAMVGQTVREIKKLHPDFEVLVVDDGSTDATMQVAMEAGANVWPHPYNMGNGAAVKSGLRAARGEYVILMDADGQHAAADITKLLEHAETFDMVVGARNKASQTRVHRTLANSVYNRFASYVTKFKVEDLTSGFRLMRKSTVEQYIYLLPNTFSYPSTITMAYIRSGRSVKYVPIETSFRVGKSKIKLLRDGARFLLIITKIATLFSPMRIFLPTSLFFLVLGLVYYGFTYATQGRFTNMSALLLNSSVIVFLIGLVSEQITQLKYERTK
jgi:glycosyltransferase involved in cell wall biosynthesis